MSLAQPDQNPAGAVTLTRRAGRFRYLYVPLPRLVAAWPHVLAGLRLLALTAVLLLFIPYTVLNTAYPGPELSYSLGAVLALGVLALGLAAGLTPQALYLGRPRLSWISAVSLVAMSVLLAGEIAYVWRNGGPSIGNAVTYGLLSGVAQELFFRSALLGVFTKICRRAGPAIVLQALLFAVWHVGRAFLSVSPGLALLAVLGVFVAGCFWGRQAVRERSFVGCAAQHSLFLIILWLATY